MANLTQHPCSINGTNFTFYERNKTLWLLPTDVATLLGTDVATVDQAKSQVNPGDQYAHLKSADLKPTGNLARETYYNLSLIFAISYQVDTDESKAFRRHAKAHFEGFLKNKKVTLGQAGPNIGQARTTEKNAFAQIRGVFQRSNNYAALSRDKLNRFFSKIQNYLYKQVTHHTAAELLTRNNIRAPFMNLTNWKGQAINKGEVKVAKNYLTLPEINALTQSTQNLLSFVTAQESASQRTLKEWRRAVKQHLGVQGDTKGSVSSEEAEAEVKQHYKQYYKRLGVLRGKQ